MSLLVENPALKLFALSSVVLSLHLIALALWTGRVRTQRKVFVNPEDAVAFKGATEAEEHPDVQRVQRAHANALENALPFFVVGFLYALTQPTPRGAQLYFFTFVGARLLHTVFYLWGRQPFRTMTFATGVLVVVGMAVRVIRTVI